MKKINLKSVTELKENEYLLKVYEWSNPNYSDEEYVLGFMARLNQNGTIPKAFDNWQPDYRNTIQEVYIFEETFRSGWKVAKYRTGKSQDWVVMEHPLGFRVEIYMINFFELMECTNILNMELEGKFKWEDKKLIKE